MYKKEEGKREFFRLRDLLGRKSHVDGVK